MQSKLVWGIFFVLLANSGLSLAMMHDSRALEADPLSATAPIAPRLAGLGEYSFPVTTSNAESQYFFNQGLRLTYAFNHSEALRAFKESVRLDPGNAMAYWGWALVLGPNINLPMQPYVREQAFEAIQKASALTRIVSKREAAYINALTRRYSNNRSATRAELDKNYAEAMAALVRLYPEDLDALTLYGAALMNLSPWDYWHGDMSPKPNTEKILAAFESVLERAPRHPGAIHYYIHAVELARPKNAEVYADTLVDLMPGAGHMVHMPSHIFMRVGRYEDAYRVNKQASAVDESYIAQCKAQGIYPLNYYPHNLHFLVWAAMFQGKSKVALDGARRVQKRMPLEMVKKFKLLEGFLAQPMYVMVRFGLWEQALEEPAPLESFRFVTGVWHYMRGVARANLGEMSKAQEELENLRGLRQTLPSDYTIGRASASRLLQIAELLVNADLLRGYGKLDESIALLARATRIEDSLLYNEPPDWYFPTRHVLGATLTEAGYFDEAEAVYWQDLRKAPDNGYSIKGLLNIAEARSDPRLAEYKSKFDVVWKSADVRLGSSRF